MLHILGKVVKQHIAHTTTQNHPNNAIGEQIVQHLIGKHRIALFDAATAQPDKQGKGNDIAQGIPTDGQWPQL